MVWLDRKQLLNVRNLRNSLIRLADTYPETGGKYKGIYLPPASLNGCIDICTNILMVKGYDNHIIYFEDEKAIFRTINIELP